MNYFNKASSCRVLVAEDDVAQQMLFREVLEQKGYSVAVASSADEALRVLRVAGHVDLLIADIRLEGPVNGFELAVQARRLRPQLKTLFITGSLKEIAYRQRGDDQDADIIFKPFRLSDFAEIVISIMQDLPCYKVRAA